MMTDYDPSIHHRKSIRLSGYAYTSASAYFITLVTHNRECLLADVEDGKTQLTCFGQVLYDEWRRLPLRFPILELGPSIIMPNHFHGIFRLCESSVQGVSDHGRKFGAMIPHSVSSIVRSFKSSITLRVNTLRKTPGQEFWQRNYYERIIRDPNEYDRISQYIENNPYTWDTDQLHQLNP